MIPANLTHYIETEIIPRYEKFDKAHNLSHVQAVIEESLSLAKQHILLPLTTTPGFVMIVLHIT